jgi:hypothetical protein
MNRDKIDEILDKYYPLMLPATRKKIADEILALVSEDEELKDAFRIDQEVRMKARANVAKQMIGLYQDSLPLLDTPEVVLKFKHAEGIKDWLAPPEKE